jgi:hypothetical protein
MRERKNDNDTLVRRLAAEAVADERSIVRRLAGLEVRGAVGRRIDEVLKAHGLLVQPEERPEARTG